MNNEILSKEEFMNKFNINDFYNHYVQLHKYKDVNKRKNDKYRASEKGIIATREASKRYYYRKKGKHHPVYNPIENLSVEV